MKKLWLSATLVAALSACTSMPPAASQAGGTIKKPEMDRIAAAPAAMAATAASGSFSQFLALSAQMQPELAPAVAAYERKATLQGDDLVNISRLLGLHNRLRNQAAVIDATAKMVAIPTVRADKVPPRTKTNTSLRLAPW